MHRPDLVRLTSMESFVSINYVYLAINFCIRPCEDKLVPSGVTYLRIGLKTLSIYKAIDLECFVPAAFDVSYLCDHKAPLFM